MDTAEVHWRPLGTLLVERGLLSAEELEDALEAQGETGKRLGEILVERGLVSHPALTDTLARQYGIELTSESGFGTGLRALIERTHAASRPTAVPAPPGDDNGEPEVEAADAEDFLRASGQVIALEPQLEEHWARLAAAEANVAERDDAVEELEHELAERKAAAATQTKALNRRLGALRKELAERERKAASLATQIEAVQAARTRAIGELETVRAEHARGEVGMQVELAQLHEQGDERLADLQERLGTAQRERDEEQARGRQLRGEVDAVLQTLEERQAELRLLQTELEGERERLEAVRRERDEEQAQGRQLRGELRSVQTELDSERVRREESERDRDALAAEVAEARSAPATASEPASRESGLESAEYDRAREEQRRTVETLAVMLDEIRRDRDTVRDERSELEGKVAALAARIAELEQERDDHVRALAEAREATEQALGSANDERGKLAQLVKKLGDEQAARKRLLADASAVADRERRRAEAAEEATRQIERERERRENLLPRLETLQREVAASEQRLATAAIQVLGERRRQDEERRRAEAAEAAARRYRHRLSELEQSGGVPA